MTTFKGSADSLDAGTKLVDEQVIPAARKMDGFMGGYWLTNREANRSLAITLWETKETLDASAGPTAALRTLAKDVGSEVEGVEEYEVTNQA